MSREKTILPPSFWNHRNHDEQATWPNLSERLHRPYLIAAGYRDPNAKKKSSVFLGIIVEIDKRSAL
jgi:hypothetical protein